MVTPAPPSDAVAPAMLDGKVVHAIVSADGRLISADAPLIAAQEAAGGSLGDALLLPSLARLALLSFRLQQRIERPVVFAAADADVSALARMVPEGDVVKLSLADCRQRTSASTVSDPECGELVVEWASDIRLRLVMAHAPGEFRLPLRNYLSHPLTELFLLQSDSDGQFPLLLALAQQSRFTGQRARIIDSEGVATIVTLSGEPMLGSDGFTGFVGMARGFTPLHLPEVRDSDSLEFGSAMLGRVDPRRFALRVDGAMKKPLGRIIANAETIASQLRGPIRSEYARYAADIALAGRHLLDLVDDLADLQAVERPDFRIASERVDLADVARRATGLLSMKAQERDIRIDAPDADESAPASAEFRRVLQILINLLGNAVRYAPENSQIWLRVERQEGRALVTVADQGPGIALGDQDRLFEKFERLGRTDAGGSGLGLYISRRLARAMGGDIHLDSAPGQGARFTLDLPEWQAS